MFGARLVTTAIAAPSRCCAITSVSMTQAYATIAKIVHDLDLKDQRLLAFPKNRSSRVWLKVWRATYADRPTICWLHIGIAMFAPVIRICYHPAVVQARRPVTEEVIPAMWMVILMTLPASRVWGRAV